MISYLLKMTYEIVNWYWQMSISAFYLLKKVLRQITSTTQTLRYWFQFQIYLALLIAVLCEEKLALIGYRA